MSMAEPAPRVRLEVNPRAAGGPTGRWSRFVGLMKFGLPAFALAIAALVMLWPELTRDHRSLPIVVTEATPGEDDSLRMANPRYTGSDDDSRPYTITAETATIDRVDRRKVNLHKLAADMTLEDDRWISLTAATGIYQQDRSELTLGGPIEVYSDEGYELHARSAQVNLQSGVARSDEQVYGHGPVGVFNANSFRVDRRERRLEFDGGVRLVIHPGAGRS